VGLNHGLAWWKPAIIMSAAMWAVTNLNVGAVMPRGTGRAGILLAWCAGATLLFYAVRTGLSVFGVADSHLTFAAIGMTVLVALAAGAGWRGRSS